jgi:hypothetical protein
MNPRYVLSVLAASMVLSGGTTAIFLWIVLTGWLLLDCLAYNGMKENDQWQRRSIEQK